MLKECEGCGKNFNEVFVYYDYYGKMLYCKRCLEIAHKDYLSDESFRQSGMM